MREDYVSVKEASERYGLSRELSSRWGLTDSFQVTSRYLQFISDERRKMMKKIGLLTT